MLKITIKYAPREWAKRLHAAAVRWIVLVLHRRAGKTTAVLHHLQRDALRTPNAQYAYIGPTQKQTKKIAWKILKKISEDIPGVFYHETELYVRYPNGSVLFLAGSENIDSLRGIPLWGAAGDEWPLQDPELFTQVISKCLADHLGYFIFLGTPAGKNHFFKTYQNALKHPDQWLVIFKTVDDSMRDERGVTIENLRQAIADDRKLVEQGEMTQEEFDQEWYCSFDAAVKGAYYGNQLSEARKQKRIGTVPYDPELPVHTVWDLGVGRNIAIGFYQKSGIQLRKIDYWEGSNKDGIPQAAVALQRKPYVYGKHFAPHDIKATDQSTGKTRLDTAKKLGIDFEVVPSLNVNDGITRGQLVFSRLWIDEKACEEWLLHIGQYREQHDEKTGTWLGRPVHDSHSHAADEYRYASIVEDQMSNEERQSKWRRPPRRSDPHADEFEDDDV